MPQGLPVTSFVFGGSDGTTFKLFKKSTTYAFSVYRSRVFNFDHKFDVLAITFPVFPALAANMSIVPVLYFDNESYTSTGTTIDATNYPNKPTLLYLVSKNFPEGVRGDFNFFLELQITGSALATIGLPINIDVEVYDF